MTRLLCRIGLHQPVWNPVTTPNGWLHIRTCTHCGQPLGKRHR